MGAANPGLQGRPADHTSGSRSAPNDCSVLPHHGQLEQHHAARRPHAEPGQPGLQRLPHRRAPTNYTTHSRRNSVLHTGITGNCTQCHGADPAVVLQQ